MSRRSSPNRGSTCLAVVTLVVLAFAVPGCARETPPAPPDLPNVILMLADDLGYGELGVYGQGKIRTPSLDRLAYEGMRFTQYYSGSPVCAPSRATLLTGLHTGHTKIRDNFELGGFLDEEERGQMPLDPGTFTIGRLMQQAGYATGGIGKWGLGGPESTGVPTRQGFDYFFGYLDQKQAHNYYPTHLWRNEERVPLANEYFSPHQRLEGDPDNPLSYYRYEGTDYSLDVMADDALRFIEEHRDRPFFLYLPFTIPHAALQVPHASIVPYAEAFQDTPYTGDQGYLPHRLPRAAYAAMISRMDFHIGRLVRLLEELGLDERTLVLFSSDNGTTYNGGVDAGYFESTGGLRGLKGSVYEGGIRVPLIVRWPGRVAARSESHHVSAFWDVMPTLAELVGARIPPGLDGISFLPTLLGEGTQRQHDFLYWEYHGLWDGAQAVRMGSWKAVRLGGHVHPDAPIELYDLSSDPIERHDVASEHPDIVAEARAIMVSRTPSPVPEWNFPQGGREPSAQSSTFPDTRPKGVGSPPAR